MANVISKIRKLKSICTIKSRGFSKKVCTFDIRYKTLVKYKALVEIKHNN
jgi:hypothetical protein